MSTCISAMLYLLIILVALVAAVDRSKFRTCESTGFCRVYRQKHIGPIFNEHYQLDKSTLSLAASPSGLFKAKVIPPTGRTPLNLLVMFYHSGSIRVKLAADTPRWQPTDLLLDTGKQLRSYEVLPTNSPRLPRRLLSVESSSFLALSVVSEEEDASSSSTMKKTSPTAVLVVIHLSPLLIELFHGDELQVSLNERSLLHFESQEVVTTTNTQSTTGSVEETSRKLGNDKDVDAEAEDVDRHHGKVVVDYGEDGLAIYDDGTKEEKKHRQLSSSTVDAVLTGDNFGGHYDSMPRGPRSVGLDISFPYSQHVYGIPEHTAPLSLPTTTVGTSQRPAEYSDPYRLYNLDVFEYEIGQTMALYGNIPILIAHGKVASSGKSMTSGIFWFNPSETFVDITDGGSPSSPYKQSRWLSESGEVDVFLLPGPDVASVYRQYTALTGTQQLPPLFALGYHQCRWNYRDERDISSVEGMFEQLDYPMDVLWLDIEHTDGKRYFTWDNRLFPNPIEMQQNVSRHGRKMVTIVDPHLKRDDNYFIHKEATAKRLYVRDKEGKDFDGWCWPGSSSYLDFTSPTVREWWARQFGLDKYIGSTLDLFTWNDMNEPSVFNGPEVSMPKDTQNLEGIEHREWHNLYGIYMQMATALGLTNRCLATGGDKDPTKKLRPFVLTRSFWAGSQRYGAMWTGDNAASWSHLQIASPMLLSINLAGLSFAGADVGGFFGEPSAELFTRWYQAGAFTPFFRGHAHHDTKRREPWVFGEPYTSILRTAAMLRYSLLPYWYSVFYVAYSTGLPVMRPMFFEFPEDRSTYSMDAQWMVGSSLLVCPVTTEGHTKVEVYLPSTGDHSPWYDLETLVAVPYAVSEGLTTVVDAPLNKIPVYIRPGSIIPRKLRLRRSSKLMFYDPYTIVVVPTSHGQAEGMLYLDDEQSLAHEISDTFALRALSFANNILTCKAAAAETKGGGGIYDPPNTVERIIIAGQSVSPSKVFLSSSSSSSSSSPSTSVEGGATVQRELSFVYDKEKRTVTIKKPDTKVAQDWTIALL